MLQDFQPDLDTPVPPYHGLLTGHYRMETGYRTIRTRGSRDWLLILTVDGEGLFVRESGERLTTHSGDTALLAPSTPHDYGVSPESGRWDLLWAHFEPKPAWTELLRRATEPNGLTILTASERRVRDRIEVRLRDMHRYATSSVRFREELASNALEEVLIWLAAQAPSSDQTKVDERVTAVRDFVLENLAGNLTLGSLAKVAQVSPSRLIQLFRQELRATPMEFVEQQRLARAEQLLARTSQSVGAIAADVGFESPFYFTLRFKKRYGLAPSVWRVSIDRGAG